jgi:hypothetical protein
MISNLGEFQFTDNKLVLDISEWETLTIQVINPSGSITLEGTNDSGAVTGQSNGGPNTATNFSDVYAVELGDSTQALTNSITNDGLYRISPVSFKYLQIGDGATATADKILVFRTKPY